MTETRDFEHQQSVLNPHGWACGGHSPGAEGDSRTGWRPRNGFKAPWRLSPQGVTAPLSEIVSILHSDDRQGQMEYEKTNPAYAAGEPRT